MEQRQFDWYSVRYAAYYILGIQLTTGSDDCIWNLEGSYKFTVKETRHYIDDISLPDGIVVTRWNMYVPRKVNILNRRVFWDKIPTR